MTKLRSGTGGDITFIAHYINTGVRRLNKWARARGIFKGDNSQRRYWALEQAAAVATMILPWELQRRPSGEEIPQEEDEPDNNYRYRVQITSWRFKAVFTIAIFDMILDGMGVEEMTETRYLMDNYVLQRIVEKV